MSYSRIVTGKEGIIYLHRHVTGHVRTRCHVTCVTPSLEVWGDHIDGGGPTPSTNLLLHRDHLDEMFHNGRTMNDSSIDLSINMQINYQGVKVCHQYLWSQCGQCSHHCELSLHHRSHARGQKVCKSQFPWLRQEALGQYTVITGQTWSSVNRNQTETTGQQWSSVNKHLRTHIMCQVKFT